MRKTSSTQFDMMVTFMEQHGDITKPSEKCKGKAQAYRNWENLANLLNSDASGPNKTDEEWKRVWRDLKSNTKKKSARILRGGGGTGGGPALNSKLNDVELRVLQIMGPEAATGIVQVREAGLSQEVAARVPTPPAPTDLIEIIIDEGSTPAPPLETATEEENVVAMDDVDVAYNTMAQWNEAGPSRLQHIPPPDSLPVHPPRPASVGQTTPRRQRSLHGRVRRSPWRRASRARPMNAADRVQQAFQHSDEEWRNFLSKKEEREADNEKERILLRAREEDNERERLKLRARELQVQEAWQDIMTRALTILEKHF